MAPNASDSFGGRLLKRSASGSLFLAFWSRSGRFRDLRPAKAAARRAGHHGLISSLHGRLLSRFSARGGNVVGELQVFLVLATLSPRAEKRLRSR